MAAGLLTPLAGAALSSVMFTAIRHVHAGKGPSVSEGGYEYNLVRSPRSSRSRTRIRDRSRSTTDSGSSAVEPPGAIAQLAAGAAGSELISRVAQSASGFEVEAAAAAARDAADASTAASA